MQEAASSFTAARTEMLPSGFFLPAMPVILDDPSSIATINSFAIRYNVFFFCSVCCCFCSLFCLSAAGRSEVSAGCASAAC